MNGTLYGVGVGPGDPELLTLKAMRLIREADAIAVPAKEKEESVAYRIVRQAYPEIQEKNVLAIEMPMTKDKEKLAASHRLGAELLEKELSAGKNVVFLTLGDPTVYSTYLYIHRLVGADGFPTEIVSGIPSFCAVAARMNMGLVEKADLLHVIPSSYPVETALQLPGTRVLMKAGKKMGEVKTQLQKLSCEVSMIENCGMENEKIYTSVDEIPEDAGYYSLIIVKEPEGGRK
ncbi:precorrin-2 C(20)-methyltransferase [Hominifimenecus sp. rT4P-3]|uniref:precorrin-2 C(20)-methyltransferase n=1 Tax=Hominifimenecus sp. rT4P-3 TaxID=3242979 RepID=UPI003DA27089